MILVTGATGTVGSQVVRELEERGRPVRAFVRDRARGAERLGDGVELAVGDFADPPSLLRAMDGADAVLLACSNQPRQVEYESAVIDAATAAGVRRLVKLSAVGAEIGSPLAFWDWHGLIEQRLREAPVPSVVLRSSYYMTNLLAAADTVRAEGKLFAPAAGARVAMVDPRDVAAVAAIALVEDGHDGQTYVLTGPESLTWAHIASDLSAVTGRPVEFVDVPAEAMRRGAVASGVPEFIADQLVTLYRLLREGAGGRTTDDVRAVTGREPRPFARWARDHAAYFGTYAQGSVGGESLASR